MRRIRFLLAAALASAAALCLGVPPGRAGGFTLPEGQGQIIAGVGYIAASRSFDRGGSARTAPPYRKAAVSAFVEYGLRDWLTLIAAPTLARMQAGTPTNAFTGSDESGFGARLRLWGSPTRALAVQVLAEPPVGRRRDPATEAALGGPHAAAADLRLQYAQAFPLFGVPAFATFEPGARLRGGGWPNEARLDLAAGLRPLPQLLVLLQSFNSVAGSAGPLIPRMAYSKLQASLVYDLSPRWSAQVGGLRTLAGRNAAREFGPFGALWYRF